MANIDPYLKEISDAVYGEEVRGSIINALKKVNDDNESYIEIKNEIIQAKDDIDADLQEFSGLIEEADTKKAALSETIGEANTADESLGAKIATAGTLKDDLQALEDASGDLVTTLNAAKGQAETAKENLDTSIEQGTAKKTALDESISGAGTAKQNLDASKQAADTTKTNLDGSITTAGEKKTALDGSITEAETKKTALDGSITNAGEAKTNLDSGIEEVNEVLQSIPEDYTELSEEVSDLKSAIENLEAIPHSVKMAMDTLFSKAAYADADAASSYATFHAWAVASSVVSITAVFTQGSAVIYDTDSLDTLKQYLVVTANFSDSTTATVTDYTLSGTLTAGTSTITVSYGGKTDTFDVAVSPFVGAWWDYTLGRLPSLELDGISTTLTNSPSVTFVEGEGIHYVGKGDTSNTYAMFTPENYTTAKRSILEIKFIVRSVQGTSSISLFALSLRLSNGTTGVNMNVAANRVNERVFHNYEGSTGSTIVVPGKTWEYNTEYTARIEYTSGGTQYFYLNDKFMYSTTNVSGYYTTSNRFFIQGNGTVDVHSLRWTILEV